MKDFFSTNLKFLINRKNISQEELAEAIGMKRSRLKNYLNGTQPSFEVMICLSEYFKMSIDTLIKVDLSKLSELKIRELEAGNDTYTTGTKIRILATTIDNKNRENIEWVPVKAKAGYLEGYSDPEFISSLPSFHLPMLPKDRKFRLFPVEGDSMLPFPDGCYMIGEYIDNMKSVKDGTKALVISKGDGFVLKEIYNRIEENRTLLLKSLNHIYQPYEVHISDVLEIWKFRGYIDFKWPDTLDISSGLKKIEEGVAILRKFN